MSIMHALQHRATRFDVPFRHWIIEAALSPEMVAEIGATGVPEGRRAYDGTRAADHGGGGLDAALRCYVTPENIGAFPALKGLVGELLDIDTIAYVGQLIERDLREAFLRVEVIVDRNGFWLERHKDIKEKLMSMQLYVNLVGESENLGTDIYDPSGNVVKTIPYRNNTGYFFAPGSDTWHGFEKKTIEKERRSVLINYVTFETGWKLPS